MISHTGEEKMTRARSPLRFRNYIDIEPAISLNDCAKLAGWLEKEADLSQTRFSVRLLRIRRASADDGENSAVRRARGDPRFNESLRFIVSIVPNRFQSATGSALSLSLSLSLARARARDRKEKRPARFSIEQSSSFEVDASIVPLAI